MSKLPGSVKTVAAVCAFLTVSYAVSVWAAPRTGVEDLGTGGPETAAGAYGRDPAPAPSRRLGPLLAAVEEAGFAGVGPGDRNRVAAPSVTPVSARTGVAEAASAIAAPETAAAVPAPEQAAAGTPGAPVPAPVAPSPPTRNGGGTSGPPSGRGNGGGGDTSSDGSNRGGSKGHHPGKGPRKGPRAVGGSGCGGGRQASQPTVSRSAANRPAPPSHKPAPRPRTHR